MTTHEDAGYQVVVRNWWCDVCRKQKATSDLANQLAQNPTCKDCKSKVEMRDFVLAPPRSPGDRLYLVYEPTSLGPILVPTLDEGKTPACILQIVKGNRKILEEFVDQLDHLTAG